MNNISLIASKIIKDQETIIGPVAIEQARKVQGLEVKNLDDINIKGDAKVVIGNLVNQYVKLFGRASIEVCKESIREISPKPSNELLPDILK